MKKSSSFLTTNLTIIAAAASIIVSNAEPFVRPLLSTQLATAINNDQETASSIQDRVDRLIADLKRQTYTPSPSRVRQLPPPIFTTAEEITAFVRDNALRKRDAVAKKYVRDCEPTELEEYLGLVESDLPSIEQCKTFRLPEAATELFLRAEYWEIPWDETLYWPLFKLESFDVMDFETNGEQCWPLTLEDYSPAWIDIGRIDSGRGFFLFLMCVDPSSTEFGDLKRFFAPYGNECIKMACDERNHDSGENFLNFLEQDVKFFVEKEGNVNGYESVFMEKDFFNTTVYSPVKLPLYRRPIENFRCWYASLRLQLCRPPKGYYQ